MDPMRIVVDAMSTTIYVAGPILAAALAAGIAVGLVQAVIQVNEASLSFLVKLAVVAGVLTALGGGLAENMVGYTRRCFGEIEKVVH